MRKLASIRKVSDIQPIPDADRICVYVIDGWKVVDSIGKYNIGDLVVYFEVDSFLPNSLCPFLSKGNEPKEYNGIKGERLRTIKLKKTLSQGLILPLYPTCDNIDSMLFEGLDVTIPLGIQLYEPPVPACLSGTVKGNFPSRIPKTDQERCLSGDTLIDTLDGKLSIKTIVDNKLTVGVYSFNHANNSIEIDRIIGHSVMNRRKGEWLKITLKSGKELIVTKNHKIWCDDISAYREAKDIIIGQSFITKTD